MKRVAGELLLHATNLVDRRGPGAQRMVMCCTWGGVCQGFGAMPTASQRERESERDVPERGSSDLSHPCTITCTSDSQHPASDVDSGNLT